ncbi:hypothetical protein O6P43_028064 [Quillaja saponaria]|uniref:Uncharacterized protein n=1 Tax=Quillaja saponaria TaxID=32244 RepID=A0AAD7KX26_QUISA|nr:hypothetical protein O6P43_028064 [Quillaja saponaria]
MGLSALPNLDRDSSFCSQYKPIRPSLEFIQSSLIHVPEIAIHIHNLVVPVHGDDLPTGSACLPLQFLEEVARHPLDRARLLPELRRLSHRSNDRGHLSNGQAVEPPWIFGDPRGDRQ